MPGDGPNPVKWLSPVTGLPKPNWSGIVGELWALRKEEIERGDTARADGIYRLINAL